MTDRLRAAAQAALKFAEFCWRDVPMNEFAFQECEQTIDVLSAALAEQEVEQEPVAWCWKLVPDGLWHYGENCPPPPYESFPLYTTPPCREWKGLTDAEIKAQRWLLSGVKEYEQYTGREQLSVDGFEEFARAIESKLKEKNHD